MLGGSNNWWARATARARGDMEVFGEELTRALTTGEILIPQVIPQSPNIAGGTNHCPDSDLSYSLMAATVIGTLPGTAGDTNHEAFRFYRQQKGANVTVAASNALKATSHSLFAANETATPAIPRWDRENGWVELGSTGTQYDIAIHLLSKIVFPGQRWFVRFRCAALNGAIVPANVQAYAGVWVKTSTGEGWASGDAFTLNHSIHGIPGAQNIDYRVLAKTDSGVSILSNVLNVPNAPSVLSAQDYIKLFYNAGAGFIEFHIYKKVGSVYTKVHTVRNSTDLQFNDIGDAGTPETGWPTVSGNAVQAYAETNSLRIGAFNSEWQPNDMTINVPATYNYSLTNADGTFLRIGLTNPTGVDRHIGIDRIWFAPTYNEWTPDVIRLSDGTLPVPSVSPTSGNQGGGGGVFEPPPGGGGGGTCVLMNVPVLAFSGRQRRFRQYRNVEYGDRVKGEHAAPYLVLNKQTGTVSEYYVIKTRNGITVKCSVDHPFIVDTETKERVEARHVEVGMKLACWVNGRKSKTNVVSTSLIPKPAEVGTFTLRHTTGLSRDGHGMYIAGYSKNHDRGLYCGNWKIPFE